MNDGRLYPVYPVLWVCNCCTKEWEGESIMPGPRVRMTTCDACWQTRKADQQDADEYFDGLRPAAQ